jgi:hypothetical protein
MAILWLGGYSCAGMLYYPFECVLGHCVLKGIVFVRLGNVGILLCLIMEGVGHLHILQRYDW